MVWNRVENQVWEADFLDTRRGLPFTSSITLGMTETPSTSTSLSLNTDSTCIVALETTDVWGRWKLSYSYFNYYVYLILIRSLLDPVDVVTYLLWVGKALSRYHVCHAHTFFSGVMVARAYQSHFTDGETRASPFHSAVLTHRLINARVSASAFKSQRESQGAPNGSCHFLQPLWNCGAHESSADTMLNSWRSEKLYFYVIYQIKTSFWRHGTPDPGKGMAFSLSKNSVDQGIDKNIFFK